VEDAPPDPADDEVDRAVATFVKGAEGLPVGVVELGTPDIRLTSEGERLLAMGERVLPAALRLLEADDPRVVASTVLVLRSLGNPSHRPLLQALRERFSQKPSKSPWDFAVIGQCNLAIEELRDGPAEAGPRA